MHSDPGFSRRPVLTRRSVLGLGAATVGGLALGGCVSANDAGTRRHRPARTAR